MEGLAFAAKDALLIVDDFAPGGAAGDVARPKFVVTFARKRFL